MPSPGCSLCEFYSVQDNLTNSTLHILYTRKLFFTLLSRAKQSSRNGFVLWLHWKINNEFNSRNSLRIMVRHAAHCFRAISKEEDTDDLLTVQTGLLIKDAFEFIKCKLSKKKARLFDTWRILQASLNRDLAWKTAKVWRCNEYVLVLELLAITR